MTRRRSTRKTKTGQREKISSDPPGLATQIVINKDWAADHGLPLTQAAWQRAHEEWLKCAEKESKQRRLLELARWEATLLQICLPQDDVFNDIRARLDRLFR